MKATPLLDVHRDLGARLVDFGGWQMPLQYRGILEEGKTVRRACGLFDLGHMGRFHVVGPDALRLVDRVCTNHAAKIPLSSIRYSLLCNEHGYPLDDLLIYREEENIYLVVNASNSERDLAWIRDHGKDLHAECIDLTDNQAMLALQGPESENILQRVVEGYDLSTLKYYNFGFATVCGMSDVRISRTGYTGEDGFEIYFDPKEAENVWAALLEAGKPSGIAPIGLGARDILRLEAGMALYGHELDETSNPMEAGVDFAIALTEQKGDFIGRKALERLRTERSHRLVGIVTEGPRVPRQGNELIDPKDGQVLGRIVSGGVSPTLETNIGSAFIRLGHDQEDQELVLDIRGKHQACKVRDLPFYSRTRKKKTAKPF
ncbi:MAG: glycine cleavage system protein T [Planctomycetes bacterium]|nr:glycine cleavage system protein T [Planctomycetota bacterium]